MTNRTNKMNKLIAAVAFAGAIATLAGCQTDKSGMDSFFPQDEARSTKQFMNAQAASGARADAMLRPMHFDGEKLNSLGMDKLDTMLKDDDSVDPMTVYLNMDEKDSTLAGRKEMVTQYLIDHGLVKDQIVLKVGPNPGSKSLSAEHLSRVGKTESSSEGSSGASAGSAAGSAAPSGGSQPDAK